jgi:hypothetical protein
MGLRNHPHASASFPTVTFGNENKSTPMTVVMRRRADEGVQIEPDWATNCDGAAQPAPDFEVDQRVSW